MLNDTHHTASDIGFTVRPDSRARAPRPRRDQPRPTNVHDGLVKSATRALEIIELFAVRREALSVNEIAIALGIPQSSSSMLLQAMNKAGFIDRNRQTRKYLPSIRSVFLGNWIHDALYRNGSLLKALDTLSAATGANVRLGVLNGIHVQYVHVSWPGDDPDKMRLRPGTLTPICHDALGRMLLIGGADNEVRGIVRHANAAGGLGSPPVNLEDFMGSLARSRAVGYAEGADCNTAGERVIAVQLPTPFGVPAAIGLGLDEGRLPGERIRLLEALNAVVNEAWRG